jgi:O-antigen/teichoic acid export membrane protein
MGYRRLAVRGVLGAVAVAIVTAGVAWPLGDAGILLVFDPSYLPAVPTFRILLIGLPFVYATWVLHAVAMSAFRTHLLLGVTAAGTLLNVALNFVLIPRASFHGAAAATVVSEILVVGLLVYGMRDVLMRGSAASGSTGAT